MAFTHNYLLPLHTILMLSPKTMKRSVSTLLLLFCLSFCWGQKIVRLLDSDTKIGIKNVTIATERDILTNTNADGMAHITAQEGKIIFAHESYDRIEMAYDSIPDIIYMERRGYTLEEVEVLGIMKPKADSNIYDSKKMKLDMQLAAIKPADANLLAPIGMLIRGLSKKKKQDKRRRLEQILDKATKVD